MIENIERGRVPALLPWLQHAQVGVAVIPHDVGDWFGAASWHVEVHNGLEGNYHLGTVVARCGSEQEAELIAAALWSLLEIHQ